MKCSVTIALCSFLIIISHSCFRKVHRNYVFHFCHLYCLLSLFHYFNCPYGQRSCYLSQVKFYESSSKFPLATAYEHISLNVHITYASPYITLSQIRCVPDYQSPVTSTSPILHYPYYFPAYAASAVSSSGLIPLELIQTLSCIYSWSEKKSSAKRSLRITLTL